jgi:hypothetical protein
MRDYMIYILITIISHIGEGPSTPRKGTNVYREGWPYALPDKSIITIYSNKKGQYVTYCFVYFSHRTLFDLNINLLKALLSCIMDKLQLTGRNLDRVFNTRNVCTN